MKSRQMIRNGEEIVESYRRRQVYNGQWSEEDSYALMQKKLEELQERFPTKKAYDIYMRDLRNSRKTMIDIQTMDSMNEREYYFDEGLG